MRLCNALTAANKCCLQIACVFILILPTIVTFVTNSRQLIELVLVFVPERVSPCSTAFVTSLHCLLRHSTIFLLRI